MRGVDLIQKYQTALGIQEPERSYTTGNSPPLVSALLAARPQRGVRPFSYVCTDTNQFSRTSLMFSSSVQRGPHVAECDLLRSLAPGLSSLSNGGRFGKDATSLASMSDQRLGEKEGIEVNDRSNSSPAGFNRGDRSQVLSKMKEMDIVQQEPDFGASDGYSSGQGSG